MNKTDLVNAIRDLYGPLLTPTESVEAVLTVIADQITNDDNVTVTGFGTFERVERAPRTGRNPRTGERIQIERKRAVRFKPGTALAEAVRTGTPTAAPVTKRRSPRPAS